MRYNPLIFIRDYGTPTIRMLAYTGPFHLDASDARFLRGLVLIAENPVDGEEVILLSGDEQTGSDSLSLSGEAGTLLVTNSVRLRLSGKDIVIRLGRVLPAIVGSLTISGTATGLLRSLRMPIDGGALSQTGSDVGLLRHLVFGSDTASQTLTGSSSAFRVGRPLLLSGDEQSGTDSVLLSGDEQTGTDVLLFSEVI